MPITLNSISISGGFNASNIASQAINGGGSIIIPVSFTPTAIIFYTGVLTISTSIGDLTVILQGRGAAHVVSWVVNPVSINFGHVTVGDSVTQNVTVTNTGNMPLAVGTLISSSGFYSATASSGNLAIGGNITVAVKFKPTTIAPSSGQITINGATSGLASLGVNVNGIGYVPNTPPVLTFVSATPYSGTAGVNPTVGQPGNYTYKIVYSSSTNTPPQNGTVQVGIDKNADGDYIDAGEGIYAMTKLGSTTNWVAGEEYVFTTVCK